MPWLRRLVSQEAGWSLGFRRCALKPEENKQLKKSRYTCLRLEWGLPSGVSTRNRCQVESRLLLGQTQHSRVLTLGREWRGVRLPGGREPSRVPSPHQAICHGIGGRISHHWSYYFSIIFSLFGWMPVIPVSCVSGARSTVLSSVLPLWIL